MGAKDYGRDDDYLTLLSMAPLDTTAPLGPLATALLEWRREVESAPLPADPMTYA